MIRARMHRERIYCTATYWDEKARDYQGDAVSMWRNNQLNVHYYAETAALFAQHLPDVRGRRVLDVGCGTGRNSRFFAQAGAQVLGIDFSMAAIDIARNLSPAGNPEYRVQSVFDIDDHERFDVVVSWGTLTIACRNRADLAGVVRRLRRAIVPGGTMLLLEPVHKGWLHRVLDLDLEPFCQVVRECGFEIRSVSHHHFWPVRLLLAYIAWPSWITTPGYRLGAKVMDALDHQAFGDYQAILASVPATTVDDVDGG